MPPSSSSLTWAWSVTKGADLSWVPVPFERSFRMAYSRTRYGTGYYTYHQYVGGANLSRRKVASTRITDAADNIGGGVQVDDSAVGRNPLRPRRKITFGVRSRRW